MKCKVNPKYRCFKQYKTGHGKWDYAPHICQNCEIFNREKQILFEVKEMMKDTKPPERKESALKWIASKKQEIEAQRKADRKEKGMEDFFNMPVGETEITIDASKEPRIVKTKWGNREVLHIITKDNEAKDWMINPKLNLYLQILENLSNDKTHMVIVRSGLEMETRYSIKSAW
jgi:hypothetical protein